MATDTTLVSSTLISTGTAAATMTMGPTAAATSTTSTQTVDDTSYYLDLIYTASSTCSSIWTFHTTVPLGATDTSALTPVSTIPTSLETETFTWTPTPSVTSSTETTTLTHGPTLVLRPIDVLPTAFSSLQSSYSPPWATECTIPANPTYAPKYTSDSECEFLCGSDVWIPQVVGFTILGWFMVFFIWGLGQNFGHFRELCLGCEARRGLPRAWSCVFCPLSCLFLIGSSRGFEPRSAADREELRRKWQAMPASRIFKLWLKWGFRKKYPTFLGPTPPRLQKKYHNSMAFDRGPRDPRLRSRPMATRSTVRPLASDGPTEEPPPPYTMHRDDIPMSSRDGMPDDTVDREESRPSERI